MAGIPVQRFAAGDAIDVLQAVERLRPWGPVVALDSALARAPLGQRSFVAGAPLAVAEFRDGWRLRPGRWPAADLEPPAALRGDPFAGLEAMLERLGERLGREAAHAGAFGYFGYECTGNGTGPASPADPPDAWFLLTDTVFQWELAAARPRAPEPPAAGAAFSPGQDLTLAQFQQAYRRIREALQRGDSYQLCYTYPIERAFHGDPWRLYCALRQGNPAPFAAFVEGDGLALASSSPERFLTVDRAGHVTARPMKGTARKGTDEEQNAAIRRRLLHSAKEQAENLMIADLLRNDLGRVCRLGSVRVTEKAALEEYATVFQLVSSIEGDLAPGRSRADLLHSAFPPGSMTGAPKRRAMEILAELEGRRRGPYSGVLGYWLVDGRMDLSVLIRTWVLHAGKATCGVGGGIVWDSTLEEEFQETRIKAAALLQALESVEGRA